MTHLVKICHYFCEINGPKSPDDLSDYALRLLKKNLCSFLCETLSQNDPKDSKIQNISEKRILF